MNHRSILIGLLLLLLLVAALLFFIWLTDLFGWWVWLVPTIVTAWILRELYQGLRELIKGEDVRDPF